MGDDGFAGRSVLVTGGSRGIGLAVARRFLTLGATVTISGRDATSLERARHELEALGQVAIVAADVATVQGCRDTVTAALKPSHRLDVLVANAGNYETAPLAEITEELWDRTLDAHLKGAFFCIQAAANALIDSSGCVVTMASDAGIRGLAGGWAPYCAAMGGLINLTRQLALDLAPDVRVNAVAPGPVATEHLMADLAASQYGGLKDSADPVQAIVGSMPLGRLVTPEEVANAVVFLASSGSMTGAVLSVDAGTTTGLS